MGIFDGFMLCVDFDGTAAANGRIVESNLEPLRHFMREGGIFTICTGRQPEFMADNDPGITLNAPLLAMNGTILYDLKRREILRCWTVGRSLWEDCEQLFLQYPEQINAIRYYAPAGEFALKRGENTPAALHPYYDLPLYKVIVIVRDETSDEMLAAITQTYGERYHVSRSWIHGIELQSPDSGKGVAVNTLRAMQSGIHTVVCAGDYENDLSMLHVADISYAVDNAVPAVKAAAMRHTVACGDGAIAHIIAELEQHIQS